MRHTIALLVSGASGMLLPRRFLARLAVLEAVERVHLVVSAGASRVLAHELGAGRTSAADLMEAAALGPKERQKIALHRNNDLAAPIASGSYPLTGTVVLPCSAGTLGALATGSARTLIHRAGAVALKERWPLVLGFRETPLSLVHLENLRRLAYAGATILPPIPAFYIGSGEEAGRGGEEDSLGRFLDHYALRVFDHLGIEEPGAPGLRWS